MKTYTLTAHSRWRNIRDMVIFVLIVLVCTLGGMVVSLVWPVSFQASAVVIHPDSSRVAKMNMATDLVRLESGGVDQGLYELASQASISSDQAFDEFIAAYTSTDTKRNFYLARELFRLQGYQSAVDTLAFRQLVADFSSQFGYQNPDTITSDGAVVLHFTYHNAEGSAELLNAFIDHAAGIAATNLQAQHNEKMKQLRTTLDTAVGYYQSMQQTLGGEQSPLQSDVTSIEDAYLRSKAVLMSDIRRKQLQAWHLSQALASTNSPVSEFKPVRIISLANAEGSTAQPSRTLIVMVALFIGVLVALLVLFSQIRKRQIRVVSE